MCVFVCGKLLAAADGLLLPAPLQSPLCLLSAALLPPHPHTLTLPRASLTSTVASSHVTYGKLQVANTVGSGAGEEALEEEGGGDEPGAPARQPVLACRCGGLQVMLSLEPHAWQQVLVVAASPDVEGDFEQVTLRTVVYYQLLVFL